MKELDKLKEIFLAGDDLDEETKAENEQRIREWEEGLLKNEAMAGWRDHDVTKQIAKQARETYKETVLRLGVDRKLSIEFRAELFAKQDAALWLLSLIEVDAKGALEQIQKEIRTALNATN